jgi:hypothetical protein
MWRGKIFHDKVWHIFPCRILFSRGKWIFWEYSMRWHGIFLKVPSYFMNLFTFICSPIHSLASLYSQYLSDVTKKRLEARIYDDKPIHFLMGTHVWICFTYVAYLSCGFFLDYLNCEIRNDWLKLLIKWIKYSKMLYIWFNLKPNWLFTYTTNNYD